jgi:SNF2 family DNA or RNA helicase
MLNASSSCTKEMSDASDIYVNPGLINVSDANKLKNFSFGDICRYATFSDEARKFIEASLKLRPLPLKKPYNLYPHQEEAISFIKKIESSPMSRDEVAKGGVISLKMGMGKTLAMLSHILTAPKGKYPTLIVVSKTIVRTWMEEGIHKFFSDAARAVKKPKVCVFTRKDYKKYETISPVDFKECDIVITTYSTLTSAFGSARDDLQEDIRVMGDEHSLMNGRELYLKMRTPDVIKNRQDEMVGPASLFYTNWERIVCDEAHVFSNPKTIVYRSVTSLVSSKRWCLTGTPFRNDYEDIYAILRFVGWDEPSYRSYNDFKHSGERFIRGVCKRYILSMGYEEAKIKLPKTHEIIHTTSFSNPQELQYYRWLFSYLRDTVKDYEYAETQTDRRRIWGFVLALFTHLRQATVAAVLTCESLKIRERLERNTRLNNDFKLMEWLPQNEGTAGKKSLKLTKIVEIAKTIPVQDKFIVFSTFSGVLHLLFDVFEEHLPELGVVLVDGENSVHRDKLIESFKNDRDIRALFITYKIGSEGLNLTEANHCIFVDPWWTDVVHQQARARILRTGQTKETYVHHIEIENTIEQRILQKCREKNIKEQAALGDTYQKVESGISLRLIKELLN